jgi:DNA-3-methyladenine glycosylase
MREGKRCLRNGTSLKRRSLIEIMISGERLSTDFYIRDVLEVAPGLIGKNMIIRLADNTYGSFQVTDVEAYRGVEDKACHASKGRTARTEVMFREGGKLYLYMVYGMYWMLNVVTAESNNPQAVLIRGLGNLSGPGRLTKALGIDRSFNGEDLTTSDRIWFEETGLKPVLRTGPRIGIDYSGEYWKSRPWRFYV